MMSRITQGTFAFVEDLTNDQIRKQIEYYIAKGFAISIEWTDDVHPRNSYWELWGLPMFGVSDAASVMYELNECRRAHAEKYIKISVFNNSKGVESTASSFFVQRPEEEPGFYLQRQEAEGRVQRYSILSYAVQYNPVGERYSV